MKKTVLVVDDDLHSLGLLRAIFTNMGYRVLEAADVNEAVVHVLKTRVDLVTLDLSMPGHSGVELLDIMQKEFCETPCIVVSGCPAATMKESCEQLGALGYIEKPFSFAELSECVQSILAD